MKSIIKLWPLIILVLITACSNSESKSPEPSIPPPPPILPITEIYQTFAEDYEVVWDNLIAVLNDREIGIEMSDKEIGRLLTKWIDIEDFMCGLASAKEAPLQCRVQFSIAAARLVEQGSSITIRYLETCLDREQMTLVCPKSKAERLMVNLIDDLKALAAVQKYQGQKHLGQ